MSKRAVFIILFLTVALNCFAQFPSEIWHEGKMVLISGDTLRGQLKYDLETDLVQYSTDRRSIKTFTARKLLFFEIFDNTANAYRTFYVLPYSVSSSGYKAPIIFELIFEGQKLTLLSREAIEYTVTNYPYSISGTYTRLELVYTHFFLNSEGNIIKFDGKKKTLLRRIMADKAHDLKKYIKSNRLRVEKRTGIVRAVAYYNSLFEDNKTTGK